MYFSFGLTRGQSFPLDLRAREGTHMVLPTWMLLAEVNDLWNAALSQDGVCCLAGVLRRGHASSSSVLTESELYGTRRGFQGSLGGSCCGAHPGT